VKSPVIFISCLQPRSLLSLSVRGSGLEPCLSFWTITPPGVCKEKGCVMSAFFYCGLFLSFFSLLISSFCNFVAFTSRASFDRQAIAGLWLEGSLKKNDFV
jgi:hypothetical protein